MSTTSLSLILSSLGLMLGFASILLTILFAVFHVLAALIVAAFLLGTTVGAAVTIGLLVLAYRALRRLVAESTI